MSAATFKELKAAFPKADSDFITDQLEQEATLEQAQGNWTAHLELKAEAAEADAKKRDDENAELRKQLEAKEEGGTVGVGAKLTEKTESKFEGNAIEEWKAALATMTTKCRGNKAKAVSKLSRENPALYEAYKSEYAATVEERKANRDFVGV